MGAKKKRMTWLLLGIGFVILAMVASYFFLFRRANPPLTENQLKVGNTVFTVELATSTIAQARGLSFRASLSEGHGMLFIFNQPAVQNFWMKDMNFSLDMIWIGGGKVLGFAQNAAPQPGTPLWSLTIYNSPDGTDEVLEVNAGTVAQDNIQIGDPVTIGI
jgi:uncharacterized membrane protein (UPF0127 family)